MKKNRKFIIVLLTFALLMPVMAQKVSANESSTATRLFGDNRILTSIRVSTEAYKASEVVVLAGYSGEVDAMTGTLLASAKNAPLLLTGKDSVHKNIKDELERLNTKTIYILGGKAAVSEKVESELTKDYNIIRVSGDNREETAIAVANEVNGQTKHVFLAKGYGILADALAIGPVSAKEDMPVLLTKSDQLPKVTRDAMKTLGVTHVTIIGGTSAISESVEAELKNFKVNRISGPTREETAIEIAKNFFPDAKKAILANGYLYADALVGGYLGAKIDSPILLTAKNKLAPVTYNYIQNHFTSAYILGGKAVVYESVESTLNNALRGYPANETLSQQQAIKKAQNYLEFMSFSRIGLIDQLIYEGFSGADATYAVDKLNINWKEQARKKALDYLESSPFSRSGLIDQLIYEEFTDEEATYGVNQINIDWKEQAVRAVKQYLDFMAFSRESLIEQLIHDGFSTEEATYAVDRIGLN